MNILNEIAARTKVRVKEKKKTLPIVKIKEMAKQSDKIQDFPFEKVLRGDDITFICEVKKASPSKLPKI